MDDERIIELFFARSEQGIRELDDKYGKACHAYIARIVRNVSLKCYRKMTADKRDSRYTVAMEEIEDCITDKKSVEDEIEAGELARMIEAFLDALTVENRVIFMRRYYFADSLDDIAGYVGLTEKNVSVRLTRMRKNLRQYLIERGVIV